MVRSRAITSIEVISCLLAMVSCTHEHPRTDEDNAMIVSHPSLAGSHQTATFAAGCFWGVEAAFAQIEGVTATRVGYTGGDTADPTYEQVCTGRTGHAEAVEVTYDPQTVTYDDLLTVFWASHDPTTVNRQGPDVGTQYRSAIFVRGDTQQQAAQASKSRRQSGLSPKIATEIVPAGPFYQAEEYHQKYLARRGLGSCRLP